MNIVLSAMTMLVATESEYGPQAKRTKLPIGRVAPLG